MQVKLLLLAWIITPVGLGSLKPLPGTGLLPLTVANVLGVDAA
jgi:hypothetical protein